MKEKNFISDKTKSKLIVFHQFCRKLSKYWIYENLKLYFFNETIECKYFWCTRKQKRRRLRI